MSVLSALNQASQLLADPLLGFGEEIQLSNGAVVYGLFDAVNAPPTAGENGPEVGSYRWVTGMDYPAVWLLDVVVASQGMVKDGLLTIRGLPYRVVRLLPDGQGLTLVTLRPAGAAENPVSRWK